MALLEPMLAGDAAQVPEGCGSLTGCVLTLCVVQDSAGRPC